MLSQRQFLSKEMLIKENKMNFCTHGIAFRRETEAVLHLLELGQASPRSRVSGVAITTTAMFHTEKGPDTIKCLTYSTVRISFCSGPSLKHELCCVPEQDKREADQKAVARAKRTVHGDPAL